MEVATRLRRGLVLVGFGLGWLGLTPPVGAAGNGSHAVTTAERLVADALRAELVGDAGRRDALLCDAVAAAPDFAPARWHRGEVLVGSDWLPVDQAQRAAAADPQRQEYARLRSAAGDALDDQLTLARWCRKHGFDEEARFHWTGALAHDPDNDEAQRALGVRWFNGRLMTFAEADAAKAQLHEARQAAKEFAPRVASWERLLSAGDINSRDQALDEIRALDDAAAIPALEDLTLDGQINTHKRFERSMQMGLALVAALERMPSQPATKSLVRHAVLAPVGSVRAAAIAALKKRPPHDYLPLLLSALAMPIESSFRVVTDSDGSVHYFHTLYREGQNSDWSFEGRLSAMQHDLQGPVFVTVPNQDGGTDQKLRLNAADNPVVRSEMAAVARKNERQFNERGLAAQGQIAAANRATAAANTVLVSTLTDLTGEDFGDNPRAWWDWWRRYNEYSSDDEKPVQEQSYADSTHRYYRPPRETTVRPWRVPDKVQVVRVNDLPPPRPPMPPRFCECFAEGTLVWTRVGLRPIESLDIGDFVLSQSSDTGELAYKPVIGRTVRPPTKCVKLSAAGDELQTTLGHPFWVDGVGWRMAKLLGDGAILHSVDGPVRVDGVSDADEAEAYNLIVADFNTYFVGNSGVLVHDNTPRTPTTAQVPGLSD